MRRSGVVLVVIALASAAHLIRAQSPTSIFNLDLTPSERSLAQDVLDRWYEVQGGPGGWSQLRSYEVEATLEWPGKNRTISVHTVGTRTGHFRNEIADPVYGTMMQAYDGRLAWQSHSRWGLGRIGKPELQTLIAQTTLGDAADVARDYPGRSFLGHDKVDGLTCSVLGLSGRDNVQEKWYFDDSSGHLLRTVRPEVTGQVPEVVVDISDFRRVGDITLPFRINITSGKSSMIIRRSKIVLNSLANESSFVIPSQQLREIEAADAILARYTASCGKIKTGVRTAILRTKVEESAGGTTTHLEILTKSPNLILSDSETDGAGRILMGFDGHVAWMNSELEGVRPLKPQEVDWINLEANDYTDFALASEFPLRKRIGSRLVDKTPTDALVLATSQGAAGTFYFDKENGRLIRRIPAQAAGASPIIYDYFDYRDVDGIEVPYTVKISKPAGQVVNTVQSVEFNVYIDTARFAPQTGDL